MDFDKITAFVKALGFPVAVAVWFMWKVQAFLDILTVQNATMIELLRQLLELHK